MVAVLIAEEEEGRMENGGEKMQERETERSAGRNLSRLLSVTDKQAEKKTVQLNPLCIACQFLHSPLSPPFHSNHSIKKNTYHGKTYNRETRQTRGRRLGLGLERRRGLCARWLDPFFLHGENMVFFQHLANNPFTLLSVYQ